MSIHDDDEWDARLDAAQEAFYQGILDELGPQYMQEHAQELYAEHYDQAIQEFRDERLASFYNKHPELAHPASKALKTAQEFKSNNVQVSFIFAAIAVELLWKRVLLSPMLFGLIHVESLAELILELFDRGNIRMKNVLEPMLNYYCSRTTEAANSADKTISTLFADIETVARIRNKVVHRGEEATSENAELAVNTALQLVVLYAIVLHALKIDPAGRYD